MQHRALQHLLDDHVRRFADDEKRVARVRELVAAHDDCLERSCRTGHITASAWIVSADSQRFLLTHHRKLGRWLQLGGHADGNPNLLEVALCEAREESGMQRFEVAGEGGRAMAIDVDVHAIPARPGEPEHEHHDIRFLLRAAAGQELRISRESLDLRWFDASEIEARCGAEESLLRLARRAQEWLGSPHAEWVTPPWRGAGGSAMASPNAEQIEYWNEQAGPRWVQTQPVLDAQLEPLLAVLLEQLAPASGERILDVGCGCGATTLALAERVGAAGLALGVDVSGPMLAHARARARKRGSRACFVRADAQLARTLPASFDALTSRFGVMFFSDPAAAFANLAAALRPGGRVVFACWQPLSENTWMSLALAAASEHVPMPPPADPRAPGPFAFGDEHYLRACLSEAGLEQIDLTNHRSPMSLGGPIGLDGAVDFSLQLGPASRLLRDADAALRERVRAAVRNALAPHETPEGVILGSAIWLASARRPLA